MPSTCTPLLPRRACALALAAAVLLGATALPTSAQLVSDARRLGSFSGAMRYCEERYGGSERRFRFARLRTASVISDMDGRDMIRALAARDRAYERGQFIGDKLDPKKCSSLLKLSEWKAFSE